MSEQVNVRIVEAQLSVVRPGDKVLVRMQRDLTPGQVRDVAEQLRERMPDVDVCVICGVDGIDVYRAGSPVEGEPG